MNLRTLLPANSLHFPALILVIACVVSSCSDSDNSVAGDTQSTDETLGDGQTANTDTEGGQTANPDTEGEQTANPDTEGEQTANPDTEGEQTTNPDTEGEQTANPDTEGEQTTNPDTEDGATENNDPVVDDPIADNSIPVTFEITVPFYLSNELSVELVWGEINLTAMWVGGQFWSASGEFPIESENILTITFFDRNGAIELARYSQSYATESDVSEAVQIRAEQFDASQFDQDGDGVNNLDELNAGTDPLVDESVQLDIEDFYAISDHTGVFSRMSVSESFESRLSDDRPLNATFESDPDTRGEPVDGTIDIDANGNGTLDVNANEELRRPLLVLTGTRTRADNSVTWAGTRREWSSDYFHTENVTNTVSVVDESVRTLVEEVTGSNRGAFEYTWETSANLTGTLIEGTSLCKPVAGLFTARQQTADPVVSIVQTTISKEIDDRYWRVVVVDDNANNVSEAESQTREYFVRELRMQQRPADSDSAFFVCDFVEF